MKLEQQVCSLELAKRLKELNVKQESLFYWCGSHSNPDAPWEIHNWKVYNSEFRFRYYQSDDPISAFTVAELGEMLPKEIDIDPKDEAIRHYHLTCTKWTNGWIVDYEFYGDDSKLVSIEADTEADARGTMLQYLLENGIIKVDEIN